MSLWDKAGKFLKDFPIIGDMIGGVGDYLSGKRQQESVERQNAENLAHQKEFAQSGVRWRVEDAKAAGVHPLFALGASTSGFTPNPVIPDSGSAGPALSRIGQSIGNAASKSMTLEQKMLAKAQLRVLDSEVNKNDAEASASRSQAMVNLRDLGGPGFPGSGDPNILVDPESGARLRRHPAEQEIFEHELLPAGRQVSRGKLLEYGWQQYDFGNGPVTLFAGDPDNLMSDLQDMDNVVRAAIVAENAKRGQSGALMKLFDAIGNQKRKGKEYGKRWKGTPNPGGGRSF